MSDLRLKIVTPDRVFFDGSIRSIVARGTEGDFSILKNHSPFVTILQISRMKVNLESSSRYAAIAGGYITVSDNQITIMSDACEWEDEIDEQRALEAKERAERKLKASKMNDETLQAEVALKRAINRLNVKSGKE